MRQIIAKLTSKGQVTVPVEVRRHLGVEPRDRVAFVIADDGTVEVRPAAYPTLESLRGIAGTLPRPMDWPEMMDIAREDWMLRKFGPSDE